MAPAPPGLLAAASRVIWKRCETLEALLWELDWRTLKGLRLRRCRSLTQVWTVAGNRGSLLTSTARRPRSSARFVLRVPITFENG